ncbi:hypothetical protein BDN71DRAFT_1459184 [Pleurotus eryngii]|uniref:Uncharacterized protein n=1 Tax=Pleurotus eryngii TaxID=5323 RepID=A0A9P6D0U1_PLEER|nr:hypothetical protein BDN71DRAFT_1459184 [Pleurotus eryngii]
MPVMGCPKGFWVGSCIEAVVPVMQVSVRQRRNEKEEVASNASLPAYWGNQGQFHHRETWAQGRPHVSLQVKLALLSP